MREKTYLLRLGNESFAPKLFGDDDAGEKLVMAHLTSPPNKLQPNY